ncbi:uncharacterized protein LOC132798848 [Drosophila nasuta]|uniref:uncharacterized protein LOC132798848 n=1 Tax=Drosophila nasuta TaxID=42062 RepID=UPI00295E7E69|nr:uncharacterized protein LOC132798848 [Drosophila nasuta]
MKEKWYKSGLFCLLMSLVVLNIGADETPSAEQNPTKIECDETCGSGNQTLFDNCTCGCEEGYEKDDQDFNCVKSVCAPECPSMEGVKCQRNECVCKTGYLNVNGKPGAPNCVLNTTTQFTEQSTNVTLPHTPTTQNSTATKATSLTPTSQGTLTIHLNITTITQDSNPVKKPDEQKYVMGKWAITGIIVLVACLVGALVYVCYKNRHRGSLRIATSTTL